MTRRQSRVVARIIAAVVLPAGWLSLGARDARACGGCFHPPPMSEVTSTVVTDHRMAFSISPTQTVLWDQIRYSGNPSQFAWILPVRQGTRIELSQDAWMAALDASTASVIEAPFVNCPGPSGGGGIACGGMSSAGSASSDDAGAASIPPVEVISQQVVGPYDAVTVRSSAGEALGGWLRANGFDVPAAIQPTIDAYTSEGFDFIALKLMPGASVQAMQPVRIVSAGAGFSLPLRMVAAGVGNEVGIELFVLSEARYHPQNFPDVAIDFTKLTWDPAALRSNYSTLAAQTFLTLGGRGWLTESAQPMSDTGGTYPNPALGVAYRSTCVGSASRTSTCTFDAGSAADAAAENATGLDGGGEGGLPPPSCVQGPSCDDLTVALNGIQNLWVTRLRANLPASALKDDLFLEAAPSQQVIPSFHHVTVFSDPKYVACPSSGKGGCAMASDPHSKARYGDVAALSLMSMALAWGLRRRRQRRLP